MKNIKRIFSFGLIVAMIFSLCVTQDVVFAEQGSMNLTDTNNFECVGTVTEDFNEVENIDALYDKTTSGDGVLSGKWRLTEISHVGKGANEIDAENRALKMMTTKNFENPGGVDFVFDTPLTPDYILDVSYDMYIDNLQTLAIAALTNGNYTTNQSAGFSQIRDSDGHFIIYSGNAGGNAVEAVNTPIEQGTVTVKSVYNLWSWTYDARVYQNGNEIASVTAGRMGPYAGGEPVCKPGTTYEKLSFFTQVGTARLDNISIKAYKPTSGFALEMSETFDGKTVGAMSNVHVENGMGSWVANTLWGGGYEYAEYINSNGNTDIGIRASGAWNRLQYVPGVNFNKLYDNNSEITVKFDFIIPDTNPQGWVIMEWGDGFTNEYRNVPFFALNANGDNWAFTYPNDTVPNTEMFASPLATLEKGKVYTYEGKIYPVRETTSAIIKEGNAVKCKCSYKGGQWRDWTEGSNVHTMSVTNDGMPGIIFDNFNISSKEAACFVTDFSNCNSVTDLRNLGLLIEDNAANNISVGAAFESDPQSPSMCLGSAAHGANVPILPAAAYEGTYKVSYWAYNSTPNGILVVDAPMKLNSFDNGSLGLLKIESNRAYLGDTAITELQASRWYRFENIINLDARNVSTTIYNADGLQIGKAGQEFKNFEAALSSELIDHFIGIRFRNWGDNDAKVYIDNIEASRIIVKTNGIYAKTDFTETSQNTGMSIVNLQHSYVEREGRKGMLLDRESDNKSYMLFDVDDDMAYEIPNGTPIEVRVDYFDEGNGFFVLAYDAYDAPNHFFNGIWGYTEVVPLTGTGEWKSHTFYTEKMKITNRADGADFRIGLFEFDRGTSVSNAIIGSVELEQVECRDQLRLESVDGGEYGNIYSKDEEIELKFNFANKTARQLEGNFTYTAKDSSGNIMSEGSFSEVFPVGETVTVNLKPQANKYGIYTITINGNLVYSDDKDMEPIQYSTEAEYSLAWKVAKENINDRYGTALLIPQYQWSAGNGVAANIAADAGIRWNREEIQWKDVEKSPGVYEIPEEKMRELRLAKEAGMKVELGLVYSNPACYSSFLNELDVPTTAQEMEAFGNWCEWMARETRGVVDAFGTWNEVNADVWNTGNDTPEHFAKVMELMYTSIKKGNPDALLLGPETTGIDLDFTRRVFAAGGLKYLDAVSVHYYDTSGHFNTQKLMDQCNELKALIEKYGEGEKKNTPIWFTEFGFGTVIYTPEEQASNFVMAYALEQCFDLVDVSFQFRMQDDLLIPQHHESEWGLIRHYTDTGRKNGAKPAYLALCAMNNLIGIRADAKDVIQDGTTYAFRFYNNELGKDVALLISEHDQNLMTLDFGTNDVEFYDMYGNKINIAASEKGVYDFNIGRTPLYVVGNFTKFEQIGTLSNVSLAGTLDFSGCSSMDDLRNLGFVIEDNAANKVSVNAAFGSDPQSPSMCLGETNLGVNLPIMNGAAYHGAYKVSYWIYNSRGDGGLVVDAPMILNSFENGSLGLLRVESNKANLDGTEIANLEIGKWYRIENIIDLDARKVSAAVYTTDGEQMGKAVKEFKNFDTALSSDLIDHFIGIRFRNWTVKGTVYIDNIEASSVKSAFSGIAKDGKKVRRASELRVGDSIAVKLDFDELKLLDENCYCILAIYDAGGKLIDSTRNKVTYAESDKNWSGCETNVPEGFSKVKIFVWKDNLEPLMKPIILGN